MREGKMAHPGVLTVEEAAALLKVTQTTVRRWCLSGRLPAFKIGRAWRIPWASLERLIHSAELPGTRRLSAGEGLPAGELWSRMAAYYERAIGKEGTPPREKQETHT